MAMVMMLSELAC